MDVRNKTAGRVSVAVVRVSILACRCYVVFYSTGAFHPCHKSRVSETHQSAAHIRWGTGDL